MAGVPGFEPGNARIKTWCLTAWRYPIREILLLIVLRWLGYQDSNLGMPGSKPGALPLGDTPILNSILPRRKWCGRQDLNLHTLRRQNLNLVRLPISPLPQNNGGYDGIRTCDPNIMSVVL